jgi:hypothetical protein
VSPNYHKRIKAGEIINNDCHLVFTRRDSGGSGTLVETKIDDPGNWSIWTGPISEWLAGPLVPDDGPSSTLSPNDVKLAALARMDATEYAFGEDIGEIGQTVKFLKNPIRSLTDLALKFEKTKRRKIRNGATVAKATADSYATYQWAFKPLVRSASDLAEALNTQMMARQPRYSSRASLKREKTSGGDTVLIGTKYVYYRHTLTEEVKATVLYENHRNDNDTLKKYGLRLKDAPETAWQLFPLSFMVDRVVNISNVISAATNLLDADLRILAASTTQKLKRTTEYKLVDAVSAVTNVAVTGNLVQLEEFDYIRQVWSPSMSDIKPPITPGNLVKDVKSILDLTALITQRIT